MITCERCEDFGFITEWDDDNMPDERVCPRCHGHSREPSFEMQALYIKASQDPEERDADDDIPTLGEDDE